MTQFKPYLTITRLLITSPRSLNPVYDEKFHFGVNIIRGQNGSGKSTISNFLYYALGGDYFSWNQISMMCKDVYVQLEVNGASITLKRAVSPSPRQAMSIFYGTIDESLQDAQVGWSTYQYSMTDSKESFSNAIFKALQYPEVRSENDNLITLHQILRLIYIDQQSPVECLFKFERFDPPLMKQAISELLLGVFNDSLYLNRILIRELAKEKEAKEKEVRSLRHIIQKAGGLSKLNDIQKQIDKLTNQVDNISTKIISIKDKGNVTLKNSSPINIERLIDDQTKIKKQISRLTTNKKRYEIEILDSNQFIESLEKRVSALDSSIITRSILGELPLTNCPQCLSPLSDNHEHGVCSLCSQPLTEEQEKTHAKRLRQEIDLQIKESRKILKETEQELEKIISEINPLVEEYRQIQKKIDIEEKNSQSTRNSELDELFQKKGAINNEISFWTKQIELVNSLDSLNKQIEEIDRKISKVNLEIQNQLKNQEAHLELAMKKIEELTLELLRLDLNRQKEFKVGQNVKIDFVKDSYSLDGNNNFSASSNTLFKTCVRFAIFFASLELDFFRYPRFILCDNMEDKGMEPVRAQNLQKSIIKLSQKYSVKHQIIFTTSMISEELNNSLYCVGDEYTNEHQTLEFT